MKDRPDGFTLGNRDEHVLLAAIGDLHRDARRVDQAGGLEFGNHSADGGLALRAAGQLLNPGSDAAHIPDQASRAIGIGGQAANVREDDQPFRAGQDGDMGGKLVIVAKARADELIIGNDVVFIEDGDDAFVRQQVLNAALDVAVERAAVQIEIGQQDLRDMNPGAPESLVVEPHQPGLAQRGTGLKFGHSGGAFGQCKKRHAATDRAGTDDEHFMAASAQLRDLGRQLLDLGQVDPTLGVAQNAGAELDHPTLRYLSGLGIAHRK